jgi:ACS family D-galactonate transporter-like MFS transporter
VDDLKGTAPKIAWEAVNTTAAKPTATRKLIVAMLFVSVVINYLDRSSISIAGPHIADDLGLSPVQMGLIFSAFAWAYSPLQIPGSFLVDRIVPRVLYPIAIALWSLFSFLQGFAGSLWQLFALRMGVGASEVPSYPMNNRIITTWLPEKERATAVGVYVSGQYVGLAFLSPVGAGVLSPLPRSSKIEARQQAGAGLHRGWRWPAQLGIEV